MTDYSTGLTVSYQKANKYTDLEDTRWWYIIDSFDENDPEYGHKEGVCIYSTSDTGKVQSIEVTISLETLVEMTRRVLEENGGGSITLSTED